MFAILFILPDGTIRPLLNIDATLRVFHRLDSRMGANAAARKVEKIYKGWEARVISINEVN